MIGNAEEIQTVSVVNLNSGKSKKVGLGVYNLDSRTDLPKMPRLSKKRELFDLPKTTTSMVLS